MATISPEPGERFLPVPGYEGLYEVSNRGRVWSFYGNGRFLKAALRSRPGYQRLYVTLCKGTRETNWSTTVHRLVMLAFAGPCPEGQEVRHLDGDPFRNWWPENLAYGTHKENGEDMASHGFARAGASRGTEHFRAKLTEELAIQIRSEYAAGGVTERDLASRYSVNRGTIHWLLARKTWTHV